MEGTKQKIKLANQKILKPLQFGGQTKSQANIKKYFEGRCKNVDSERNSNHKLISITSGAAITTTSSKKLRDFSSVGSFHNAQSAQSRVHRSKNTESESIMERKHVETSGSPDSDLMNFDSGRPSKHTLQDKAIM